MSIHVFIASMGAVEACWTAFSQQSLAAWGQTSELSNMARRDRTLVPVSTYTPSAGYLHLSCNRSSLAMPAGSNMGELGCTL